MLFMGDHTLRTSILGVSWGVLFAHWFTQTAELPTSSNSNLGWKYQVFFLCLPSNTCFSHQFSSINHLLKSFLPPDTVLGITNTKVKGTFILRIQQKEQTCKKQISMQCEQVERES